MEGIMFFFTKHLAQNPEKVTFFVFCDSFSVPLLLINVLEPF